MKNISVHIKKGEKTTFTFKKPIATYGTRIAANEVTVFWNFRNITTTIGNNTFIRKKSENGGTDETKTINDGITILSNSRHVWQERSLNFR